VHAFGREDDKRIADAVHLVDVSIIAEAVNKAVVVLYRNILYDGLA
jgi:hypothetical protein